MAIRNSLIAASFLLYPLALQAQQQCQSNIHLGLVYPLSSNGAKAKEYVNGFSLHAIAGVSSGEKAFAASGASNIILNDAKGCSLAGFSNHIGGNAEGLVAAGFLNYVRYETQGFQASGFANISGNVTGIQTAGFGNLSRGDVSGSQLSGFINISQNTPVQVAGFINLANEVKGAQAAGFINKAGDVNTQVAGFINIAREVKGVQIAGFINIADSSDYPIGIINIVKKGEKAIGVEIDENATVIGTFRSGGKKLYGLIGTGYNIRSNNLLYALEAGMGAHLYTYKAFRINIEGTATCLTDFWEEANFRSALRIYPSLKLGNKWELFAGPSLNFSEYDINTSKDFDSNYLWTNTIVDRFYCMSFGAFGGVQLHL